MSLVGQYLAWSDVRETTTFSFSVLGGSNSHGNPGRLGEELEERGRGGRGTTCRPSGDPSAPHPAPPPTGGGSAPPVSGVHGTTSPWVGLVDGTIGACLLSWQRFRDGRDAVRDPGRNTASSNDLTARGPPAPADAPVLARRPGGLSGETKGPTRNRVSVSTIPGSRPVRRPGLRSPGGRRCRRPDARPARDTGQHVGRSSPTTAPRRLTRRF
jgi:hypothetical protein